MIPLSDVIAALQASALQVETGMFQVVGTLMEQNAQLSKDMVGHELPIWPPLAPSTVEEKTRLGYVGHISDTDPLLRTGKLRQSIEAVVHIGPGEIVGEVGTDVPYAREQENGSARIPPRPFISPPFITMEPRASEAFGELATELLMPERHR